MRSTATRYADEEMQPIADAILAGSTARSAVLAAGFKLSDVGNVVARLRKRGMLPPSSVGRTHSVVITDPIAEDFLKRAATEAGVSIPEYIRDVMMDIAHDEAADGAEEAA